MLHHNKNEDFSNLYSGIDIEVPVLNGERKRYVNFDNAASTPPFKVVLDSINEFVNYYSSVHRGMGFKSQLSTQAYEDARRTIMDFVGADPGSHVCIFGKNTTEAINKLARRFPFSEKRHIVITSGMEHHSNDLPWRSVADVIHVALTPVGELDEEKFDEALEKYSSQVALVAITGASNVTGYINPYHRLAEKAHKYGAKIAVDCAQLAPHRRIDMLPVEDPAHLDFLTISAHKLYAPFGTGALIGLAEIFAEGEPDLTGGGTVDIVTLEDVIWTIPPERDEAGSPNTVGAVAFAAAIQQLNQVGMDQVAEHEAQLTAYTLDKLNQLDDLQVYGDRSMEQAHNRLGVIPFNFNKYSHFLASAILGYEFGIGVRNGCFCAHPYVLHLLNINQEESLKVQGQIISGNRTEMPGLLRASFGLYNTLEEIDIFVEALKDVLAGNFVGIYHQDQGSGDYSPDGWEPDFENFFSITEMLGKQ